MKTDIYTKIVLTVIAIALSAIALQNVNFVTTAKADTTATAPAPIPTATQDAPVDVNITHIDGKKINIDRWSLATDGKASYIDEFKESSGLPIDIRKSITLETQENK